MSPLHSPLPARKDATEVSLRPGGVFSLDGVDALLRVALGCIEIYGMVGETRCFLGVLEEGATLVGGGSGRLIALAPDGATLIQRPAGRAEGVPDTVETWIRALSTGIASYAPARPDLHSLQSGEGQDLVAGGAVTSGRGLLWMRISDPGARFLGIAPIGGGVFPLTPATWVAGPEPWSTQAQDTLARLSGAAWQDVIRDFHAALAWVLRERIETERAAETARVAAREIMVHESLVGANKRLVGVLSAKLPKPAEHTDDINHVLDLVSGLRTHPFDVDRSGDLRVALARRGIQGRAVNLFAGWWKQDRGKLIGFLARGGTPVALIPGWSGHYRIHQCGRAPTPVGAKTAELLDGRGIAIALPLENRSLTLRNLVILGLSLCRVEVATIVMAGLGAALMGLLLPLAVGEVIDTFIPDRLRTGVLILGAALVMLNLCSSLLQFSADMARLRIDAKLSSAIQAGLLDRILRLPSRFLKSQSSADLTMRVTALDLLRRLFANTVLGSALAGVFGLTSFGLLFYYSVPAALVALLLFAVFVAAAIGFGLAQVRALTAGENLSVNLAGLTLQMIQNVAMLRAYGAERRAFTLWARNTATMRSRNLRARLAFIGFETFLACYDGLALAAVFLVLGLTSEGNHLSTGAYLAFVVAYQGFLVSSEGLGRAIIQVTGARPMMERAAYLLSEVPETAAWAHEPGHLRGEVEVSSVSFSYEPDLPLVLNSVSIRVEAGKFVAIAGSSGCGKSTLMGLILGFLEPNSGAVLYDGQDLSKLNKTAVRRQIGVVRQGGKLTGGSIFENIIGMHDGTIDDVWAAAEAAGIADDIRALPMGMHTVLNEGVPTFSGGQVQRLLIARALVGKPKILLLDEATSALDNLTQAAVSDSVERLGVTRLVIAHRLSTIRNADRIHFLERGRVAESGTYEELMSLNGLFAAFASRQTL